MAVAALDISEPFDGLFGILRGRPSSRPLNVSDPGAAEEAALARLVASWERSGGEEALEALTRYRKSADAPLVARLVDDTAAALSSHAQAAWREPAQRLLHITALTPKADHVVRVQQNLPGRDEGYVMDLHLWEHGDLYTAPTAGTTDDVGAVPDQHRVTVCGATFAELSAVTCVQRAVHGSWEDNPRETGSRPTTFRRCPGCAAHAGRFYETALEHTDRLFPGSWQQRFEEELEGRLQADLRKRLRGRGKLNAAWAAKTADAVFRAALCDTAGAMLHEDPARFYRAADLRGVTVSPAQRGWTGHLNEMLTAAELAKMVRGRMARAFGPLTLGGGAWSMPKQFDYFDLAAKFADSVGDAVWRRDQAEQPRYRR